MLSQVQYWRIQDHRGTAFPAVLARFGGARLMLPHLSLRDPESFPPTTAAI